MVQCSSLGDIFRDPFRWTLQLDALQLLATVSRRAADSLQLRAYRKRCAACCYRCCMLQEYQLWMAFFLIEHSMMLMRVALLAASPDTPKWIHSGKATFNYRYAALIHPPAPPVVP